MTDSKRIAQAAEPVDWMSDPERTLMARNSLSIRAKELRKAARYNRIAFRRDYMGVPARWTADVYDRAAEVLETALAEIEAANAPPAQAAEDGERG